MTDTITQSLADIVSSVRSKPLTSDEVARLRAMIADGARCYQATAAYRQGMPSMSEQRRQVDDLRKAIRSLAAAARNTSPQTWLRIGIVSPGIDLRHTIHTDTTAGRAIIDPHGWLETLSHVAEHWPNGEESPRGRRRQYPGLSALVHFLLPVYEHMTGIEAKAHYKHSFGRRDGPFIGFVHAVLQFSDPDMEITNAIDDVIAHEIKEHRTREANTKEQFEELSSIIPID